MIWEHESVVISENLLYLMEIPDALAIIDENPLYSNTPLNDRSFNEFPD